MPTGIYKRTREHLEKLSRSQRKRWRNVTEASRLRRGKKITLALKKHFRDKENRISKSVEMEGVWARRSNKEKDRIVGKLIAGSTRYSRTERGRKRSKSVMNALWKRKSFAKSVRTGVGKASKERMKHKRYRDAVAENGRRTGKLVMTRLWQNKKFVEAHHERLKKLHLLPNKNQIDFRNRLQKDGIKMLRLEYRVGRRLLDIAHPSTKLDIEIDGINFHRKNSKGDAKRDRELKKLGWTTIRVRLSRRNKYAEKDYQKVLQWLRKYS